MCQIETDGKGLYLGPTSRKGFETVRNYLLFMKQGRLYDGRALILGLNSPFKDIHILGIILQDYIKKKISYTLNLETDEIDGNNGHIYRLKKIDEIFIAERDKRKELSTNYNTGGDTAIGVGITEVGLLSTIVAAPAVIGIETVSIVMGLLRVVGNQAI